MTDAIFVMWSILLCRSLFIKYIYSNILSRNIIEKKKHLHQAQSLATLSFPIHPMLILTSWLTLFLLCDQYYCTVVYLLIIYIAIFCHGTSLKKQQHLHQAQSLATPSFPIHPMLILTSWLTLFLLCNQYYCIGKT